MTGARKVLDHGYVELMDSLGDDISVTNAARVSHGREAGAERNEEKDRKLINYMMQNGHTSPFEHVVFTFKVQAPIFVFRQWHRHRTWSFNEISGRYAELPELFYVPEPEVIGTQRSDNKQTREIDWTATVNERSAVGTMRETGKGVFRIYHELLKMDVPRELARTVLPVSTYSRMYATVDLHNLFHFLKLRLHPHAQWEIRQYAKALLSLIKIEVPLCVEAWMKTVNEEDLDL